MPPLVRNNAPQTNPAKRIKTVAIAFRILSLSFPCIRFPRRSALHEKPVRFASLVTKHATYVNLSISTEHPAILAIFQVEFP